MAYALLCAAAKADETARPLPPLVAEAVAAIRQNYMALYGVEELSEQLGVTKSHLVRVFKQEMGVPPGKYMTNVRIEAVKTLLLTDEYNLDMIAGLTGFSGPIICAASLSGRWASPPRPGAPPPHPCPRTQAPAEKSGDVCVKEGGFPLGGSCQRLRPLTDDGQPCHCNPFTGSCGRPVPHPASVGASATFPRGGRHTKQMPDTARHRIGHS